MPGMVKHHSDTIEGLSLTDAELRGPQSSAIGPALGYGDVDTRVNVSVFGNLMLRMALTDIGVTGFFRAAIGRLTRRLRGNATVRANAKRSALYRLRERKRAVDRRAQCALHARA